MTVWASYGERLRAALEAEREELQHRVCEGDESAEGRLYGVERALAGLALNAAGTAPTRRRRRRPAAGTER